MDMKQFTLGQYLDKAEIPESGKPVRISDIQMAKMEDDGTMKPALKSEQLDKLMILNKTNIEILAGIFGTYDSTAWIGQAIVIYVDPNVMFGGKRVGGLRVRAYVPAPQAAVDGHGQTQPVNPSTSTPAADVLRSAFQTSPVDDDIPF